MLPTSRRTSSPSWPATATGTARLRTDRTTVGLLLLLLPMKCNPTNCTIRGLRTRMWALDAAYPLLEEVFQIFTKTTSIFEQGWQKMRKQRTSQPSLVTRKCDIVKNKLIILRNIFHQSQVTCGGHRPGHHLLLCCRLPTWQGGTFFKSI